MSAPRTDADRIAAALAKLKAARELCKAAGAPMAAAAIRRALKSVDGAHRHAVRAMLHPEGMRRRTQHRAVLCDVCRSPIVGEPIQYRGGLYCPEGPCFSEEWALS